MTGSLNSEYPFLKQYLKTKEERKINQNISVAIFHMPIFCCYKLLYFPELVQYKGKPKQLPADIHNKQKWLIYNATLILCAFFIKQNFACTSNTFIKISIPSMFLCGVFFVPFLVKADTKRYRCAIIFQYLTRKEHLSCNYHIITYLFNSF